MKQVFLASLLVMLVGSLCAAQYDKGDVEISLAGNAGMLMQTIKYSEPGNVSDCTESRTYALASLACGIYFMDGISIEPEIGILAIQRSYPGQYFIGNICYTDVADSRGAGTSKSGTA